MEGGAGAGGGLPGAGRRGSGASMTASGVNGSLVPGQDLLCDCLGHATQRRPLPSVGRITRADGDVMAARRAWLVRMDVHRFRVVDCRESRSQRRIVIRSRALMAVTRSSRRRSRIVQSLRSSSLSLTAGAATKEKVRSGRRRVPPGLRSGLQRALTRYQRAASDSPATRGLADEVFIDDGSAGPVRADADALGSNSDEAILFSDHKAVGDMVAERIVVAQSCRCVDECVGALKAAVSRGHRGRTRSRL